MRIAYFGRIVKVGNSKSVAVPKEIRILINADVGDWVRIEIEKVKKVKKEKKIEEQITEEETWNQW